MDLPDKAQMIGWLPSVFSVAALLGQDLRLWLGGVRWRWASVADRSFANASPVQWPAESRRRHSDQKWRLRPVLAQRSCTGSCTWSSPAPKLRLYHRRFAA